MNEPIFLIQYRVSAHDTWKDDTMRYSSAELATVRLDKCKESKVMRSATFRVIKRVDEVVS